jgi:integrase/recombinase XerD
VDVWDAVFHVKVWIYSRFGFRNKFKLQDLFRRTRATTLYRDGVPLEQVSSLLGHSQLETTRSHYASPSIEQMREAVNKGIASEPETPREWSGHEDEIKRRFGL